MAFFVRRRDGRYELRESVQTAKGPRARSLVNFAVLTEDVMDRAARRSLRALDLGRVWAEAERRGIPVQYSGPGPGPADEYARFVTASRRLGASFEAESRGRQDPGQAVVELARLVDAIGAPERRSPLLEYPVLARLGR